MTWHAIIYRWFYPFSHDNVTNYNEHNHAPYVTCSPQTVALQGQGWKVNWQAKCIEYKHHGASLYYTTAERRPSSTGKLQQIRAVQRWHEAA